MYIYIYITPPDPSRNPPKTIDSLRKWPSGPSPGTLRRSGTKNKNKKRPSARLRFQGISSADMFERE